MTLFERYKSIYDRLVSVGAEYGLIRGENAAEGRQSAQEKQERVDRLNGLLEQIEKYREDLDDIMRYVEPHITSRNFLNTRPDTSAGASADDDLLQERELNFSRLKRWAARIDLANPDDPYARRIYVQIICNRKYLDRKEKEFKEKIARLEEADKAAGSADKRIREGKKKISDILAGADFAAFAASLIEAHRIGQADPREDTFPMGMPSADECTVLGCYVQPLPVPEENKEGVKKALGEYYDADSDAIVLPLAQSVVRDTVTVYSTDQMKMRSARQSLQRCLYGYAVRYPLGKIRIQVLDALHYNNSWLGPLKDMEGTALLAEVPGNESELADTLKLTVAEFGDIDEQLENEDSVNEYNAAHANDPIPKRVMVLIGYPNAFPSDAAEYVNRILVNHERYGISVIVYNGKSVRSGGDDMEAYRDYLDATLIDMSAQDQTVTRYGSRAQQFRVYPPIGDVTAELKKKLEAYTKENRGKGADYEDRIGMDVSYRRGAGKGDLRVVFGVDHKGEMPEISFRSENFAAFLMGASGSGKSTLLHIMITYLIQHYHPDDVELWLADFKMSEFAQYVKPMPPHVRYILLDESPELVFDFVDKLNEEMLARQRLFQIKGWKDISQVTEYLPVVFVMIDEFSIMSQVLSTNMEYMNLLQNLLSKGRALGFKFVFSSQDYTKGIGGLTPMAKDQIQRRIAMRNNYDEIRDTLDLRSGAMTEQVRAWMEALPAHFAMVKDHETGRVSRLTTLYFSHSKDYEPQRRMIEGLLRRMRKVRYTAENRGILTDPDEYIDKHGLVIDGNSFRGYSPDKLKQAADAYRRSDVCILPEDKLICPGRPRRLAEYGFIVLTNERRENLLLVGRRQERACVMSVLASLCRQFTRDGGNVHIWAFRRNHLYLTYREAMNGLLREKVLDSREAVAGAIHDMYRKASGGAAGNDLVVILGADRLIDATSSGMPAPGTAGPGPGDAAALARDLNEHAASAEEMEEIMAHRTDEADEEIDMDLLMAIAGNKVESSEEKGEGTPDDTPSVSAEVPQPQDVAYELSVLLQEGSRQGYHFAVCLEQFPELKAAGMKLQDFRHKLAFAMSEDDSFGMFSGKAAAGIGQRVCLYDNGTERWTFRPYIHKGIEWDDWTYDDKTQDAIQLQ